MGVQTFAYAAAGQVKRRDQQGHSQEKDNDRGWLRHADFAFGHGVEAVERGHPAGRQGRKEGDLQRILRPGIARQVKQGVEQEKADEKPGEDI